MGINTNLIARYLLQNDVNDVLGVYDGVNDGAVFDGDAAFFAGGSSQDNIKFNSLVNIFDGSRQYTISGWLKTTSTGVSYDSGIFTGVDYGVEAYSCTGIQLLSGTGKLKILRGDQSSSNNVSTSIDYNDDIWHNFIIWYDGISLHLRVDDSEEISVLSSLSATNHPIIAGMHYDVSQNGGEYGGYLTNIRIYNEVKDASFRTELFEEGWSPSTKGFGTAVLTSTASATRSYPVVNTGSGRYGKLTGDTYVINSDAHTISLGDNDKIDTQLQLPSNSSWILFEVYDVEGVEGDVGYSRWTDNVSNVAADLISFQDIVDRDPDITNYKCSALHFTGGGTTVDVYAGTESASIVLTEEGEPYSPSGNWLITSKPTLPTPALLNITTIDDENDHQIQVLSLSSQQVDLYDVGQKTVVHSLTGTDVILNVPNTNDARQYRVYSDNRVTTQVKFLGVAMHSICNFIDAATITSLADLYADGTHVSEFTWVGDCNATTIENAWTNCGLGDFPIESFPNCTNYTRAFRGTTGNIPSLDISGSTQHQFIFEGSTATVGDVYFGDVTDTFQVFKDSDCVLGDLYMPNVTGASRMFENASSSVGNIYSPLVEDFSYAFYKSSLTIASLDDSSGTNYAFAFSYFTGPTVPPLDFTNITNGYTGWDRTFQYCDADLLGLDVSGLPAVNNLLRELNGDAPPVIDVSSATNVANIFWKYFGTGDIPALDFTSVTGWDFMTGAFFEVTAPIVSIDTAGCTLMGGLFGSYFGDIIPEIDTAANIDFSSMFASCSAEVPIIDTSLGQYFSYMFSNYSGPYVPDLDLRGAANTVTSGPNSMFQYVTCPLGSINTTGCKYMRSFFLRYKGDSLPEIDTSSVLWGDTFFQECTASIPVGFTTSSFTEVTQMFYSYSGGDIPALDFRNVVGDDIRRVFQYCTESIASLDITGLTDIGYLFQGYGGPAVPSVDTSSATNWDYTFSQCSAQLPSLDTSSLQSCGWMFHSFTGGIIPALDFRGASVFSYPFMQCASEITSLNISGQSNISNLFYMYYGSSVPAVDTSSAVTAVGTFQYSTCDVDSFDASNIQNMNRMFEAAGGDISNLSCDSCLSMEATFKNFTGTLSNITNTGGITSFRDLFAYSYIVDIPLFDTSGGTDFHAAFYYLYSATKIPPFNTSNGLDFSYMLNHCAVLECVGAIDTRNATNTGAMFQYSYALVHPTSAEINDLISVNRALYSYSCP